MLKNVIYDIIIHEGPAERSQRIYMRRPLVLPAAAFAAGIVFQYLRHMHIVLLIIFAAAGLSFLIAGRKHATFFHWFGICLLLFSAGAIDFFYDDSRENTLRSSLGKETEISGKVLSAARKGNGSLAFVIRTSRREKVLVNFYGGMDDYADSVGRYAKVRGILTEPAGRRNPGTFDYRLYLRTRGIRNLLAAEGCMTFSAGADRAANRLSVFRYGFEEKLRESLGEEKSGLLAAMLFGDKSGLGDDFYEKFRRNGTAHILAVSGIHIGIIYAFASTFTGGRRRIPNNIAMLFLLVAYAALAGFSPSVVRAVTMIGAHMLSRIADCRYDLMSAASAAMLSMLILNPYSLFNTGFQMSFLAIFTIAFLMPLLRYVPGPDALRNTVFPVAVIQTGMAPFTAYVFNYFSFGAFAANIAVIFLAGIIIPAGLVSMVLFSLPADGASGLAAKFMDSALELMIRCNDIFYAEGRSSMDVVSPPLFVILLYYGMLFFAASEQCRLWICRKKWKNICLCMTALIVSCAVFFSWNDKGLGDADMVFVDVGQGDCLHIRTPSGKNILIDGGGKEDYDVGAKILKPYLLKNGAGKADMALVTHLDTDHYEGIRSLAAAGMVGKLCLYDGNRIIEDEIVGETGMRREDIVYVSAGQIIRADEYVKLEILMPEKRTIREYGEESGSEDENARSLVVKVYYGDHDVLMTGDIDENAESHLEKRYRGTDKLETEILKIAHHGSRYSSSEGFMDAVRPETAVFQVGKNNYGHPDDTVIERCRSRGCRVFRNDLDGAVCFFGMGSGEKIRVRTVAGGK